MHFISHMVQIILPAKATSKALSKDFISHMVQIIRSAFLKCPLFLVDFISHMVQIILRRTELL